MVWRRDKGKIREGILRLKPELTKKNTQELARPQGQGEDMAGANIPGQKMV